MASSKIQSIVLKSASVRRGNRSVLVLRDTADLLGAGYVYGVHANNTELITIAVSNNALEAKTKSLNLIF